MISVLAASIIIFIIYSVDFRKFIPDGSPLIQQNGGEIGTNINYNILAERCNREIDSVLYNFGIKKEWITTTYSNKVLGSSEHKQSSNKSKKGSSSVRWFVKDVKIPRDLTTAEVNLDLSTYVNSIGLNESVRENIKTTAITFIIDAPSDTVGENILPLAIINITPKKDIKRDAGTLVLIINQISNFDKDELENILNISNEFSYIFPRNPEEIDLQNKLIQMNKDVLVNLTVGSNNNFDADFRIGMEEKNLKQKVKSIASDFPSIRTAILSKISKEVPDDPVFGLIINEFRKNGIHVYSDTILAKLLSNTEEESENKVKIIVDNLKVKAAYAGYIISVLNFSNDEFVNFYSEVQNLKKLGFKFYTFSRFIEKEQERLEKVKKDEELKNQIKEKQTKKDIKKKTKPKQTKKSKKK